MEQMQPVSDELIIRIAEIILYGWIVLIIGFTIGFSILYWKIQNVDSLYRIFESLEFAKLAAIVLIILSIAFLSLRGAVEGDAVVAIMSGIAGYVLGGFSRGTTSTQKSDNA